MSKQTFSDPHLLTLPNKEMLAEHFKGKSLDVARTPALVIDREIFSSNCARMHSKAKEWGADFRAHVKTHKTAEGTKLQLVSKSNTTNAVVVSTLAEAWGIAKAGLFADGTVKDILYGLPIGKTKIQDFANLWDEIETHGGTVRVIIDHPSQIQFLEEFESTRARPRKWSAFIKIDGGQKRAGVALGSSNFKEVITEAFKSSSLSVYGFYCHAGNAYASTSLGEAANFLSSEVVTVNDAAKEALKIIAADDALKGVEIPKFVLSVGSTPTAHAASAETRKLLSEYLNGTLELHAGNYPMLDLQQFHTSLIDRAHIAAHVRASVVSFYPGRGPEGTDEACIDAGAIAFSKDTGPSGSFGEVIREDGGECEWRVGRISQEHGILVRNKKEGKTLEVGSTVNIIGQHACLVAAAYPWYYIVDSQVDGGQTIVDVWVPWKGW